MKKDREIVILSGAISWEREVSLRSGRHALEFLSKSYPTRLIELDVNELPDSLDPQISVVLPIIHGDFGEDGELQKLLEEKKFRYVGSGAKTMQLTIDKSRTKQVASALGIAVLPQFFFNASEKQGITFEKLRKCLGSGDFFLKPNAKGSSLGCHSIRSESQLQVALQEIDSHDWIVEPLCKGREITVGILDGHALPPLEIVPNAEFTDYDSKYIAGGAKHLCPAPIEEELAQKISQFAEKVFAACHCRDWARVDFILRDDGEPIFLEINTIPGFTKTSFYPDAVLAAGLSLEAALAKIVRHAWTQF